MLGILLPPVAGPETAQARPTLDQVISEAVQAMGGEDNIHNLQSLVFRGFHYEGSYKEEFAGSRTGKSVMTRMRPNLRVVGCRPEIEGCEGKWGGIVEGFDGEKGWELNWPKQRLIFAVNKAERALKCGAAFDPWFVDYKQRGYRAAYLGEQTLLGTLGIAVSVTRDDCQQTTTYYFDPATHILLMQRATLPVHARGDAVDTVEVMRETTLVNGVRIPSRVEEINLQTGDVLGGAEWTSIVANSVTDAKIFEAPEVHPQGITAVVLKMLSASQHDASTAQMMEIYKEYRRTAGKNEDVSYDMNWLAYELLKVDKYGQAETVFRQIIAENPNSARAYENLAELYLQKNDSAQAKEALQHAIALGSTDPDSKKKLERLNEQQQRIK
ncbi:MAG TPA: tetratricopeptide repeat protein [Terracidiphilus sp.]|nr:tetratricopeptide repeat protein [Terracidiphilus sp.]